MAAPTSSRWRRRVLLGVSTAVWTAAPDLVGGAAARRALRAVVLVAGAGVYAGLTADGETAAPPRREMQTPTNPRERVVLGGSLAVFGALSYAAHRGGRAVERRVVTTLESRGVRRPLVWWGLACGLLAAATEGA